MIASTGSDLPRRRAGRGHGRSASLELVLIFEKHSFVWGGKWCYYDTTHFEYRPEMLLTAK
jgi:hypothetical protein